MFFARLLSFFIFLIAIYLVWAWVIKPMFGLGKDKDITALERKIEKLNEKKLKLQELSTEVDVTEKLNMINVKILDAQAKIAELEKNS